MEPQYRCVANCRYCMVGWRCIEHQAYVCLMISSCSAINLWPVPGLRLQRLDIGKELYRRSHLRKYELTPMQIMQGHWHCEVQPQDRCLHSRTYAPGLRQWHRHSRGRCNAPPNDVDWASAICIHEFNWYMEIPLSTGHAFTLKTFSPTCAWY